ncbi:MAG TPA: OmpA family protein [Candidatus Babeliales bacterium]|jgi:peptidoglycan-associated lipoprotein|nr:OmpA family protein [Candidatus Babeliales bacterium]
MKKQIVLSITMLASLAGCGPQKKPKQVTQHIDVFTATDIPLVVDAGHIEQNDQEIVSFFDEDLGEFVFADEEILAVENELDREAYQVVESIDINLTKQEQEELNLQNIYFEFNKYGIKNDQQSIIEADAQQLKELLAQIEDDTVILVEGHACHSAGSSSYNLALSERRAKYVKDLLVSQGINANRVCIVGRGQDIPAIIDGQPVTGDRNAQWLNRRVEIRLVDKI